MEPEGILKACTTKAMMRKARNTAETPVSDHSMASAVQRVRRASSDLFRTQRKNAAQKVKTRKTVRILDSMGCSISPKNLLKMTASAPADTVQKASFNLISSPAAGRT